MRKVFSKGALVLAGLLALRATTSLSQEFDPPTYNGDPRILILKNFFEERGSPAAHLSRDFVVASDRNGLDWRLLASIAFVESGGGKDFRNNNIFGWDNGNHTFPSVRDGVHRVASRLANSKLYKNKDLEEKLAVYNPLPGYPPLVKTVMEQIGPAQLRPSQSIP